MEHYVQTQVTSAVSRAIQEYSKNRDTRYLVEMARETNNSDIKDDQVISLLLMQMLAGENAEMYSALGDRYYQGAGVRRDEAKALEMFRAAADQGSARSMYDLAWYYYDRQEYMYAIDYFERCIKAQEELEPYMVGKSYAQLGTSYANLPAPKYAQAIEHLTTAADKYQNSFAARRLGMIYGEKESNCFSADKCLHYLEQAAKGGDVIAAEKLGCYYIFGDESLGVSRNGYRAEQVLLPYADKDSALLLRYLGYLYLNGDSEHGLSPDLDKSCEFYTKSLALEPHDRAEADLGYAYYKLNQYQKAEELLLKADQNSMLYYSDFLGRMYREGNLGPRDPAKALYYYQRAFSSGSMNNAFTCAEYAELLEELGDYQKAYDVAEYGHDKYNDIWFVYIKARLVLSGMVTNRISPDNAAELMQLCLRHNSHTKEANIILGQYYLRVRNYRLAEKHFLDAFRAGDADAAVYLGQLYEAGGGTVKANPSMAYEWFTKAAAAGSEWGRQEVACWRKGLLGGWHRFK